MSSTSKASVAAPEFERSRALNTKFLKRGALLAYLAKNSTAEDIYDQVWAFAEACGVRIRHDQECAETAPKVAAPTQHALNAANFEAKVVKLSSEPMGMTIAETHEGYESDATSETVRSETASLKSVVPSDSNITSDSKGSRRSRGKVVNIPFERTRDGSYKMSLRHIFDDEPSQAMPTQGSLVCRLLLSAGRGRGALQREFSGLLFDTASWLPLVTPPPAFNLRPASRAVDALLAAGAYDIIRVDDGTIITLYGWNNPQLGQFWGMASNNGYDVSSLYWMGGLTYAEVLFDLASRLYPEFVEQTGMGISHTNKTTRLTFTKLNAAYSYTIGFRHHNFHPVTEDPERMWFIQALPNQAVIYSLSQKASEVELAPKPELAIPLQAILDPVVLASQLGVEHLTLGHLRSVGQCAFETAIGHISGAAKVIPATLAFNYGYILRLRAPENLPEGAAAVVAAHPDHDHVLVETPLLSRIRRIIYERAPRSIRDRLTAGERQQFSALRAFLTPDRRDFLLIFPAWATKFNEFDRFTSTVVGEAIHILRQRVRSPPSREPRPSSMAGHIALALLNHITKRIELTAPHRDAESILRDMIVVPENAYLFLRAMMA